MMTRYAFIAASLMALASCTRAPVDPQKLVTVYKNESCGCCRLSVRHLQESGFSVQVHNVDNLGPTKGRVGIPPGMGSCHTAEINGYFIEGHVPADDIKRLLREHPTARGLTVPGMPVGSPGMEMTGKNQPYDVMLIAKDGSASVYAHHTPN
jgi:hypothetical protein